MVVMVVGGSIYIQADDDTSTLVDYRYTRKFRAERGKTVLAQTVLVVVANQLF